MNKKYYLATYHLSKSKDISDFKKYANDKKQQINDATSDLCVYHLSSNVHLIMSMLQKEYIISKYKRLLNQTDTLLVTEVKREEFVNLSKGLKEFFFNIDMIDDEDEGIKVDEDNNASKLATWCLANLDLTAPHYALAYGSLGPCILDCIYSLRTKYFPVTVPLVKRYGDKFMNGDVHAKGYTLSDFINHIELSGGVVLFSEDVLKNKQVLSGRIKADVCLDIAKKLVKSGIETKEDFANADKYKMEQLMRSVKGMGDAAINYMFMLAGDPNRCKPDVHIHHCIRDAIGYDVSNEECQLLFTKAVKIINTQYPNVTVASLDGLVWNKYRVK